MRSCGRDVVVVVLSQRRCHLQNKAKSDKEILIVHIGRVFFEYVDIALKNNILRFGSFSVEVIAGFSDDYTPKAILGRLPVGTRLRKSSGL